MLLVAKSKSALIAEPRIPPIDKKHVDGCEPCMPLREAPANVSFRNCMPTCSDFCCKTLHRLVSRWQLDEVQAGLVARAGPAMQSLDVAATGRGRFDCERLAETCALVEAPQRISSRCDGMREAGYRRLNHIGVQERGGQLPDT